MPFHVILNCRTRRPTAIFRHVSLTSSDLGTTQCEFHIQSGRKRVNKPVVLIIFGDRFLDSDVLRRAVASLRAAPPGPGHLLCHFNLLVLEPFDPLFLTFFAATLLTSRRDW